MDAPPRATRSAPAAATVGPTRPAHVRPNLKQLPHTASDLPLLILAGLLAFVGATALRLRGWVLTR